MTTLKSQPDDGKPAKDLSYKNERPPDFWRTGFTGSSNYRQPELNDEFVIRYAHLLTQQEMADLFSIPRETLNRQFGDAYRKGRSIHKVKRRKQLEEVIDQLAQSAEYNHCHKDAKTMEFKALIELWMKRYDGLGQPQVAEDESTESGDPTEIKVVRPTKDDM